MSRANTGKLELYIGAFMVAGVIMVAGMIIASSESASIWADTYVAVVKIDHVSDLKPGAPVKLGGVQIGNVEAINLRDNYIELVTRIRADVALKSDCRASIENSGIVGDTFLEFIQGESRDLLPQDAHTRQAFIDKRGENGLVQGIGTVSMNKLLSQLEGIGVQLLALTRNINDIAGDPQVKKNIKETLANVNGTSAEAKHLLRSLRRSSENIYQASRDVVATTRQVKQMAATVEQAVNQTVGDKRNIEAFNETITNLRRLSRSADSLLTRVDHLARNQEQAIKETVANIRSVSAKAKEITGGIDAKAVADAVKRLVGAIRDTSALVATIRREITIALVINKGADRIVQAKFDQMRRNRKIGKNPDKMLEEFNHWVKENLRKGYFEDPGFRDPAERPYHRVGKEARKQ